jgi:transcriptional regulator with XRE-family HTH domain
MQKKRPDPTDVHVGARVRMRRLELKMSQTGLADGLELTFQQVQKYEKGTNRIGASRLQQIARVLDVPVEFFFKGLNDGKTDKATATAADDFMATVDGLTIVRAFARIASSKVRRSVADLVKHIADGAAMQPAE